MNKNKKIGANIICMLFLISYIFIILWVTLIHRNSIYSQTITPLFHELKLIILKQDSWSMIDIIRNIFMLMPFGFMLSQMLSKPKKLLKVTLDSLVFSTFIEFSQLVTVRGTCQMDDIMNNTIGAVIGFFLWKIFKKHHRIV